MTTRKWLITALVLNVILVAALAWMWSSRKSKPEDQARSDEHPPMEGFTPAPASAPPLQPVQLSAERMQAIGVRTGKAEYQMFGAEIRATGTIEVDERRVAYVQTRYPGWIRKAFVNATYQYVKQGQPLFTIYSPELAATEQEYLLAKRNAAKLGESSMKDVATGADQLLDSARARLKQFNVSDADIQRLDNTGKAAEEFTFTSPVSGFVLERMAVPNAYVQPEMKLYTVADLASVWVHAQIFQEDAGRFRPGDAAQITVDAYPGRVFRARVEQVLPQIDATTRTLRVRIAVPNPGLMLKPGMFVNVGLQSARSKQLVVPATAVLHSGMRDVVFIDKGNGVFDPREVAVGTRSGDRVAVRSGLNAGDTVVTSASFLIDSESQLQAAAGAFEPTPAATPPQSASGTSGNAELTTNPSPAHKGKNDVRVRLTAANGTPIEGASVSVRFYMPGMPSMGMAAMDESAKLDSKGGGLYTGQVDLGSGGTWQVTITAEQNGNKIVTKKMNVTAAGGM